MKRLKIVSIILVFIYILSGCGGDNNSSSGISNNTDNSQTSHNNGEHRNILYSIGGYTIGLDNGEGMVITNGSDKLSLKANEKFTFPVKVSSGTTYDVRIESKPEDKICSVTNGSGVVSDHDITDIIVECSKTYSIGGEVAGLTGTLVLVNDGSQLTISEPGKFVFPDRYPGGTTYAVMVSVQPNHQSCNVSRGKGIISLYDIDNIRVDCAYEKFSLGIDVTGLNGTLVVENDDDILTVNSDGTYFFPTQITYMYPYSVTILAEPFYQTCTIEHREGSIYDDLILEITCESRKYSLGGRVNGLSSDQVVIQNSYGEMITMTDNGEFVFPRQYAWGESYNLSIARQPAHQICEIDRPTGSVYLDVDSININCREEEYSIGGTVTTLYEDSIVLSNNGEDLEIISPGRFTFSGTQTYSTNYDVFIKKYPQYQTCSITNSSGMVTGNVTDIVVSCEYRYYSVGGTVENLSSGEFYLQDNLGEILKLTANGDFIFSELFRDGSSYYVSILTQPSGCQCGITNNSGQIYGADVTNIVVDCSKNLTLSGTITGTLGKTIVLKNYGTLISLSTDGQFTFPNYYATGEDYHVVVYSAPTTFSCSVTNGSGIFYDSNVTDVIVSCTESSSNSGKLDPTFNAAGTPGYVTMIGTANPGSGNGDTAWDVIVDSQNNIIATGWSDNGSDLDMVIWKYREDGTIDHSFGQDNDSNGTPDGYDVFDAIAGYKQNDWGLGITMDTNSKIIVTGYGKASEGNDDMILMRLNSDGSLDTTFNGTGIVTDNNAAGANKHDRGRDVIIDSNGNIVVGGESYFDLYHYTAVIWRYKPDGTLDTSFSGDGRYVNSAGAGDYRDIKGVAYSQSTDDIIVSGRISNSSKLELLEVDDSGTFQHADESSSYLGMKVTLDNDDNVIVTGAIGSSMFIRYYNQEIDTLNIAFDLDGIVTYDSPYGGNCEGHDVTVDAEGRIIVVGCCYDGSHNAMTVWRYNSDGTLDTSFNGSGVFMISGSAYGEGDDYGHGVVIDHRGRIVVVGESHNSDNSKGKMVIWRILP